MRLTNVSSGRVQLVEIEGEAVRTAHVKAPIAEPWAITETGIAGDERAVHPDTLYAFARTGYDHWGRHFHRDPADWPDGFFGENLTLDTLDEEDVRVGDVFALGAAQVIVTGSRTPCLKLAWRLGQPRSFQKVFALSGHSGVYLGVVRTGAIAPNDALIRLSTDLTMPSVAQLCRLIASREPPPFAVVERLLAFDRLSRTIRLLLGAKLDVARRAAEKAEGGWSGWRRFEIVGTVDQTPSIRSLELRPVDGVALPRPKAGQHVAVRLPEKIVRHWSLSRHEDAPTQFRISVRRQDGIGSRWVHGAQIGDVVDLRAPSGRFVLDEGSYRPLVLVAAGIGITPLLAMMQAQLRRTGAAPVHLIYGARTPAEMAFVDEIAALQTQFATLTVHFVYAAADGLQPRGRIDADRLIALLGDLYVDLQGHRVALPWFEADIYICGPSDMCLALPQALVARGANADNIFTETFAAASATTSELRDAGVRFASSEREALWSSDDDLTLLELAEECGVAIDNDCRSGSCQTCRTRVIFGSTTVDLDGWTLPCIARPTSTTVVLAA